MYRDLELARLIHRWHADEDRTWRDIAALVISHLGLPHDAGQLAGRDLCLRAARLLGENPDAEPWA
ncbi:hypothetical protein [Amycolatopsis sp. NPDC021455]|uniref:hypothetical protein n=1 Tax=Amycolatopsis sp. NPDC021455 TaxID=3154901 RepID=UPI0033DDBFA7